MNAGRTAQCRHEKLATPDITFPAMKRESHASKEGRFNLGKNKAADPGVERAMQNRKCGGGSNDCLASCFVSWLLTVYDVPCLFLSLRLRQRKKRDASVCIRNDRYALGRKCKITSV